MARIYFPTSPVMWQDMKHRHAPLDLTWISGNFSWDPQIICFFFPCSYFPHLFPQFIKHLEQWFSNTVLIKVWILNQKVHGRVLASISEATQVMLIYRQKTLSSIVRRQVNLHVFYFKKEMVYQGQKGRGKQIFPIEQSWNNWKSQCLMNTLEQYNSSPVEWGITNRTVFHPQVPYLMYKNLHRY